VDDEQLSLAIGKNGINAELASNLTGLSVDIIGNAELIRRESEKTKEAGLLIDLNGIGEKTVYNLNAFGIKTVKDLVNADLNYLTQIPGVGPKTAERLQVIAADYFEERKARKIAEKEKAEKSESAEPVGEE
jgi:N utilization substance protein A